MSNRWWFYPLLLAASLGIAALGVVALTLVLLYPNLPSLDVLTDYRPKIPLRIYSAEGGLMGEFGEEKRALIKIADVPEVMKNAILAAEDERFYEHGGVDYMGVARAALANLSARGAKEGASTITMQVARNFFLSNEKTFTRKLSEVLLAFKIEQNLSKNQIFEIYINQIYLGQRAYGFASASQVYFGKEIKDITAAEAAMLAGLPKAPSRYNPISNPKRATQRQQYILRRMRDNGSLTGEQFQSAGSERLKLNLEQQQYAVKAEYAAEMVRKEIFEQYGENAYNSGIRVYTTIRKFDEDAANSALRKGVMEYDRRHGYRGPEGYLKLPDNNEAVDEAVEEALLDKDTVGDLIPAVVIEANTRQIVAMTRRGELITVAGEGLRFVARALQEKSSPLKPQRGSIVRLQQDEKGLWSLAQVPRTEAAMVSLDPLDGAIRALVGGFDFGASKFNHVTQAWRQPGSSIKPFIYSAALEKGFTPATIVNDAPVVVDPGRTGGQIWEPRNYDGKYEGPMRLRTALAKSKNMVSIRVLQSIGTGYAQDYITRFGFQADKHPPYLTMALGAGSVTPMQMAGAYAVFANGGYRIKPYFIRKITDDKGGVLFEVKPEQAGVDAERVIDARNAFIMNSLMRDVVKYGTAARAMTLGRQDLAGKTGTTNDHIDAWFAGFQKSLVAIAWLGFDNPGDLGNNETGSQAALPIWMAYMAKVLQGVEESALEPPEGIVAVAIDANSGLVESTIGTGKESIKEYFYAESLPVPAEGQAAARDKGRPAEEIRNQIF